MIPPNQLREAHSICVAEELYSHRFTFSVCCVELCAELDLEEEVSAWAAIAAEHLVAAWGRNHKKVLFMQRCVMSPQLASQAMRERESWVQRIGRIIAVVPNLIVPSRRPSKSLVPAASALYRP